MTLAEAHERFLADLRARGLRESTLHGYAALFRTWSEQVASTGRSDLGDWDTAAIRDWREGWDCATTHRLRLSRIKAFFAYAVDEGWIAESPAQFLHPRRPPRRSSR